METKILEPTKENIELAGRVIAEGGLVAFPTETVYGLGANALDPEAVKRVYEAKGRRSKKREELLLETLREDIDVANMPAVRVPAVS